MSSKQQIHVYVKSNMSSKYLCNTNEQKTINQYEPFCNKTLNVPMENQTLCKFSFDNNTSVCSKQGYIYQK